MHATNTIEEPEMSWSGNMTEVPGLTPLPLVADQSALHFDAENGELDSAFDFNVDMLASIPCDDEFFLDL